AEFGNALPGLLQHRLRNIGADDAKVGCVLRQRDAGADADFEHTAADLVGGGDGRLAALAEHAAEHEIVNRRPAIVGGLDHFAVEVQRPAVVKLDYVCHGSSAFSSLRVMVIVL